VLGAWLAAALAAAGLTAGDRTASTTALPPLRAGPSRYVIAVTAGSPQPGPAGGA
jgi:hypothetical protein